MRIDRMKPPEANQNIASGNKNKTVKAKIAPSGKEVLESTLPLQKLTYSKPAGNVDQVTMKKLQDDSQRSYDTLKKLIEELLIRQGYSVKQLDGGFKVDEQAQLEAAALIADDGPMGAEVVSNNIVDFAKALAGGDSTKISMLRGAIEEGFRQAEEIWGGGLPEVSQNTYKLVMEKLDAWESE